MKQIRLIVALVLCSTLYKAAAQLQFPLSNYIDTALKNNPSLKTFVFQSGSLEQKIKPSGILDDPMLYGGVMNLPGSFNFRQDMMTMKQIGIQQNFSIGKKYTIKETIADMEFEASRYNVVSQQLSLISEIKQQYYNLYAQVKAIEVAQNSILTLKSYIKIATDRYSNGIGTQQDVFKAQIQVTKMQEELIKMQSMRDNTIVIFNTLLARDKMDEIVLPSEIVFQKIDLQLDSILKDAGNNSPALLSSAIMLSKDSLSYQLARTSKIPDFNAGVWYGQRQAIMPDGTKAKDMIGFKVGLTLPIYSKQKQDPLISASTINIRKSESQKEAIQNEISMNIYKAKITADKNEKLIALYQEQLIPQATENLKSGITGYQENKIDFLTLTDNFISLYTYRLQYYQSIAEYMKAIAELEKLSGVSLFK